MVACLEQLDCRLPHWSNPAYILNQLKALNLEGKLRMNVTVEDFGQTEDGKPVSLFKLVNSHGNEVRLTNFGAILVSVEVPDRNGQKANINLGYSSIDGYLTRHPYFGSTVGRFCNRIAEGKFELDGKSFNLAINNGPNHLHGGLVGFDRYVWQAETVGDGVKFSMVSPDGDEGYPGNLSVEAVYGWNDENELSYRFKATTDAPTVLNLTNHAYWNLGGVGSGNVLEHEVQLNCDQMLDVDETLIPTGTKSKVAGSIFDFASYRKLGEHIAELPDTKGYDHCFVVNGNAGELRLAGVARDPKSGRVMEVLTTQPGMQLYVGNHLDGDFEPHDGFCMETQHFPDSPNKPEFPTTRLNPGETFEEQTVHRFSVS